MTLDQRVDIAVFDVGGTLVDETRMWRLWAEAIGIAPERFRAELDAVLMERRHHREVFARLAPGFDMSRLSESGPYVMERADLYPDAVPALEALVAHGVRVAVAANQPKTTDTFLAAIGLPLSFTLSSAHLGVAKPAPAFFRRVAAACGTVPARIAYVGDRVDNDVLPANAAGMVSVFVPRGPWGRLHDTWPEADAATIRVENLMELVAVLSP